MMQMSVMAHPKLHEDLQYLNKENAILRWVLVKSPGTKWLSSGSQFSQRGEGDA